ncbi:MAG: trypsin-like peptidase domain-containing protein [Clostridia bacterium]|nr:trypsin-like peptidase domain-containing protein [Clostridia bacterium]
MKKNFSLVACLLIVCFLLAGCDVTFVPSVRFENEDGGGDEKITFSGYEFVDGELESEISIEKPNSQKGEDDRVTSAGQPYNSITEVYHAVADSVVEISTEIVQTSLWGQYVSSGAGSGVIIEKSGLIVTNYHVIEGAKTVTVRLTDGDEYNASLIGFDKAADIAVIKIDAGEKALVVASLGCSADLEVGEDVVALGNPLGSLGGTLTTGIISAKDRTMRVDGEDMVLLQTNAAINPGNSGGGLFNMAGQLVGIVNAKISQEGIEGLGFAIPIDVAHVVIQDLVTYGYVRGVVDSGLTVIEVTNQNLYQAYYKYGIETTGVFIIESKNTDELKFGDKVAEIGGVKVASADEMNVVLKRYKVGDSVTVTVKRGGQTLSIELTLTEKVPDSVDFG